MGPCPALVEHHRDHRQVAVLVGMHQVRREREGLAVDAVLAGRVDLELLQVEPDAVDRDAAAGVARD